MISFSDGSDILEDVEPGDKQFFSGEKIDLLLLRVLSNKEATPYDK